MLVALGAIAQGAEPECIRYTTAERAGVLETAQGDLLAFDQATGGASSDEAALRLKGLVARHVTENRGAVQVRIHGAIRLPSMRCEGRVVHRLLVRRADVVLEPSDRSTSENPMREIAGLEARRGADGLSRSELERLRELYFGVGDAQKAMEIARVLFGAR